MHDNHLTKLTTEPFDKNPCLQMHIYVTMQISSATVINLLNQHVWPATSPTCTRALLRKVLAGWRRAYRY